MKRKILISIVFLVVIGIFIGVYLNKSKIQQDVLPEQDTLQFTNEEKEKDNTTELLATAILIPNRTTKEATAKYHVYLDIEKNDIEYESVLKDPVVVIEITDPEGNVIKQIDNLKYVKEKGINGFDISKKKEKIEIANNYNISANNSQEKQEWQAEIRSVNDESITNKVEAKIVLQEEQEIDQIKKKVEEQMNSMTTDELIAQMVIMKFNGNSMNAAIKEELNLKPGGVIFFADNFTNFAGTNNLINEMKQTASIPLFISVDQEGGRVQRFSTKVDSRVTTIPTMREVGNKNDPKLAYDIGTVIAEELLTLGFNMDFAPVIDVVETTENNVIGARSFSKDPSIVSNLGVALYNGILDKGVIPSYKHFPGHGATTADSHYELPVLKETKEELQKRDLLPFQFAIDHGAELIMVGHLAIPNIDKSGYPASLSNTLITGLLKQEMGYKGLVITDSLQMGAITKNYPEKQRYELAINAGVDILLMPNSVKSAINYIKESIKEGTITEERIKESVRKILTLKYTKLVTNNLDESYLGNTAHQNIINNVK